MERAHQPGLATVGIAFSDDAFLGGFVELADGSAERFLGVGVLRGDAGAGFFERGSHGGLDATVLLALSGVGADVFLCRREIRHTVR